MGDHGESSRVDDWSNMEENNFVMKNLGAIKNNSIEIDVIKNECKASSFLREGGVKGNLHDPSTSGANINFVSRIFGTRQVNNVNNRSMGRLSTVS